MKGLSNFRLTNTLTFDDKDVLDISNLLSTLLAVEIKTSRGEVSTLTYLERIRRLKYWHKFDPSYGHHSFFVSGIQMALLMII